MNLLKKLVVCAISLALLICIVKPVSAASNGTINITNAVSGQEYTIYRLLDLESYNAATDAYSYKVALKWVDFFDSANNTGALNYVDIDSDGYVTWKSSADTDDSYAEFAKLAISYAKQNSIVNDGQNTASSSTVSFNNLDLGYYVVDTSMGSLCSLNTTNPSTNIQEKNIAPTIQKQVKEGSAFCAENDANIGDTVEFKTTIIAQKGAENYILHDKMDSALKWNSTVEVKLNDVIVSSTNYFIRTSTTTPAACSGCTFDIVFLDSFCDSLMANDIITVSYSAILDLSAVIGEPGNKNTTWLSYGDSNNTLQSETCTYAWEFCVFKYYCKSVDGSIVETPLAGAVFSLLKDSVPMNLVQDSTNSNLYKVCTKSDCGSTHTHITQITTDSTGRFKIQGLDSGVYYLKEITPPPGFNKLSSSIQITIDSTGKVNASTEHPSGVSEIKVLNKTGAILPETGGMGTTVFYVSGFVLVLFALSLMIYFRIKRKKSVDKNN